MDKMDVVTTNTNFSDDYAHRGEELRPMCLYVYRMFVRRVRRPCHQLHCPPNIFRFESHYALAGSYAQEVMLHSFSVPTIDGFQCHTVHQDAEQNALLKALLFTLFCCTTPMTCGSVLNFRHMLSSSRGSGQLGAGCASQSTSTNQLLPQHLRHLLCNFLWPHLMSVLLFSVPMSPTRSSVVGS